MFVNLLNKASNSDTTNLAHPALIQMIERLSIDEAKIINHLKGKQELLYVTFDIYKQDGLDPSNKMHLYLVDIESLNMVFPDNIQSYIENLISLGILVDRNDYRKEDISLYDKLIKMHTPIYEAFKKVYNSSEKKLIVEWVESFLEITALGKMFIKSCTSSTIEESTDSTPNQ